MNLLSFSFSFLFCFSSRNRPFDFRRTSKARERVLIDCEANNLLRARRFIRDIMYLATRIALLSRFANESFLSPNKIKNVPSSFSLSSSRSSDRLSSSSSSSWERCDAPASLPDCSPTLPLPTVLERFRTGLWPFEEPENIDIAQINQMTICI